MTDNEAQDNLQQKRKEIVQKFTSFFSSAEDKADPLTQKRKDVLKFLKENKTFWTILFLVVIILLGGYIRTLNFPLLHDVTNDAWVSTDLDSHIYLKYAKMIQTQGAVPEIDMTRFVPLVMSVR